MEDFKIAHTGGSLKKESRVEMGGRRFVAGKKEGGRLKKIQY